MKNVFKLLENIQIWKCVAIALLIIATLTFLFSKSDNSNYHKVQDELFTLADKIRNHYKAKPDYWGLNNQSIISVLPEKMARNNKIISSIGREFIVGQNEKGDTVMPSQRNFMITLSNLGKKACHKIAGITVDKESNLSLQKIIIRNANDFVEFEWGGKNLLPISDKDAKTYCDKKNSISWIFE